MIRNLEQEGEAEVGEEHCLLACSPWLVQFTFLYNQELPGSMFSCTTQFYPPKGRTTHSGQGPPTSIIKLENSPQASPLM